VSVERTFVGLPSPGFGRFGAGGHPCQGVYHTPAGVRPDVAFVASLPRTAAGAIDRAQIKHDHGQA